MKKITLLFLLVIGMITVKAQDYPNPKNYDRIDNTFYLKNAEDLDNLRYYLGPDFRGASFVITGNIELEDDWEPIGEWKGENASWRECMDQAFTGLLFGQGYDIRGLRINNGIGAALFRYNNGQIYNLGLPCVDISATNGAAGLVYYNFGYIDYCYTTGNIEAPNLVGGLVAINQGSIGDCYSHCNSLSWGNCKGGLIGENTGGNRKYVDLSYSTGYMVGNTVGGLIGMNSEDNISDCFFDKMTSGRENGVGGGIGSSGIEGKTTQEMFQRSTYGDRWWRSNTWEIDNFYPRLEEQKNETIINCSGECFATGSGTQDNPYRIRNAEELECLRNYLGNNGVGKYFKLINDIDLSDHIALHYPVEGWEPIGTYFNPFKGNFNGNFSQITGIWFDRPNTDDVGLFGHIENAKIEKLHIVGDFYADNIEGRNNVGLLAGFSNRSEIRMCSAVNPFIIGEINVGGLVGTGAQTNITLSSSRGVIAGWTHVGGLVGQYSGEMQHSYAQSVLYFDFPYAMDNNSMAGGLIGWNSTSRISESYAACKIPWHADGYRNMGGFIGREDGGVEINDLNYYNVELTRDIAPSGNGINCATKLWTQGMREPYFFRGWNWYRLNIYDSFADVPDMQYLKKFGYEPTYPYVWHIVTGQTFPFFYFEIPYMEDIKLFDAFLIRSFGRQFTPYGKSNDKSFREFERIIVNKESALLSDINIYPNPTTGIVNIEGNDLNVKVYDAKGIVLMQTKDKIVDLSAYPSGVYIFNVNGKIQKVIKL